MGDNQLYAHVEINGFKFSIDNYLWGHEKELCYTNFKTSLFSHVDGFFKYRELCESELLNWILESQVIFAPDKITLRVFTKFKIITSIRVYETVM